MKQETLLTRDDGSQVLLVHELYFPISSLEPQTTFWLRHRENADSDWDPEVISDPIALPLKGMSRKDYFDHGRPKIWSLISPAELLKSGQSILATYKNQRAQEQEQQNGIVDGSQCDQRDADESSAPRN